MPDITIFKVCSNSETLSCSSALYIGIFCNIFNHVACIDKNASASMTPSPCLLPTLCC